MTCLGQSWLDLKGLQLRQTLAPTGSFQRFMVEGDQAARRVPPTSRAECAPDGRASSESAVAPRRKAFSTTSQDRTKTHECSSVRSVAQDMSPPQAGGWPRQAPSSSLLRARLYVHFQVRGTACLALQALVQPRHAKRSYVLFCRILTQIIILIPTYILIYIYMYMCIYIYTHT